MSVIMQAKDVVNGKLASCYVTIEGNRYNFMQAKNVQADFKIKKSTLPILGKTGDGNKAIGWTGSGSATFYYNTSVFREIMERFKDSGEAVYFEMQIENFDPTSDSGRQSCVLVGCNIDGGILAKLDVNNDYLDEEMDFTFEDFYYPDKFNLLDGML